jgi:hypothetical protein
MALSNEQTLWVLVVLGLCGVAIYLFVLWVKDAPHTVDPWGKETEDEINQDEAVPLCHHCFTPQVHNGWFCPECGATVGPYCYYMPYVYLFAEGEVLRAGVTERIRCSPFMIIGFILYSLGMFGICVIAAPIYWFFLFKNLRRSADAPVEPPPPTT